MAERSGSILAADFGSVTTRVVLVDLVEGEYRLVARNAGRTTIGYPVDDVSVGLYRLVQDIADVIDRQIYDEERRIITPEADGRTGVDYFLTTASAGRPLRAVVIGLLPEFSLQTALRAVSGTYVEVVAQLHLRDGRDEEGRLNAIALNRPDLIFITGGTEGGAQLALMEMVETTRLAVQLVEAEQRPIIVYAGNSATAIAIQAIFEDLTAVFIAHNIRPALDEEYFDSAIVQIGRAYDDHKDRTGLSFSRISGMSSTGVLPTAQSYALVTEYYAKSRKVNVMTVDIGSSSSVIVGGFAGRVDMTIGTTLGLGHNATELVEAIGLDAIRAWLPFPIKAPEIQNYALNKSLRPATVPMNLRELYIEHALLRATGRFLVQRARQTWRSVDDEGELPPVGVVVAGGAALTGMGNPAYDLMLIADVLQPSGVTKIKTDPHGLIPALGAMSRVNPEAVVQLLDGDNLTHLGTLISISGNPKYGQKVADFTLTTEDDQVFKRELYGGHILSLPLPEDVELKVDIRLTRGFEIDGKRRLQMKIAGGLAGLVFDARGRLFSPPGALSLRAEQMPMWINEASDDPLQPIPDEWLEQDAEEEELVETAPTEDAKPRRRGLFGRRRQPESATVGDDELDQLLGDLDADGVSSADLHDDDRADDDQNPRQRDDMGSLRDLLN